MHFHLSVLVYLHGSAPALPLPAVESAGIICVGIVGHNALQLSQQLRNLGPNHIDLLLARIEDGRLGMLFLLDNSRLPDRIVLLPLAQLLLQLGNGLAGRVKLWAQEGTS